MSIQCLTVFAFLAIVMLGCASEEERLTKELTSFHSRVQSNIHLLENHIESGRVRNAKILAEYAAVLRKQSPDMIPVIDALAADATTEGPTFKSLEGRASDAKNKIPVAAKSLDASRELTREFNSLNTASSVTNYNMALTDPINVLADMSKGKLAKVAPLENETESAMDAVGSQLVGNPTYGQWQTNNDGSTFWEWYGKYALFSSLFDRPVSYGHWSSHRAPSYYHDVGRDYYSSPKQKQTYKATEQRVKKTFAAEGKKFQSPYARKAKKASPSQNSTQSPTTTQNRKTVKKSKLVSAPGKYKNAHSQNTKSVSTYQSQYAKAKSTKNTSTSTYKSRSSGSGSSRSFRSGGK